MLERLQRALAFLRTRLRGPDFPSDPYASVRHPRGYHPGGRQSSTAVEEPRELEQVQAIGRRGER
jgi:hypothetical protein